LNTDTVIQNYARWIIRFRWWVVAASLLVTAALGPGVQFLETTSDYRIFFGEKNPQLIAYETLESTYTKTDNILFVLQPGDKNVFTRETLELLRQLTESAWQIPYSIRVDSITNFQHTTADGDDLMVADLVEEAFSLSDADLNRVKQVALHEPVLVNRLISADAATAGVMVTLQFPGTDHSQQLPDAVQYALEMVEALRAESPAMTFALTGLAVMSYAEGEVSLGDMQRLIPFMYLVMIIFMLVTLRSVSCTVAILMVVTMSTLITLGVVGSFGLKLNALTAASPIIIMTIVVADSIHILMTVLHEMRRGRSKYDALVESLRVNTEPVFLTTLTTAIGFMSLNFSDSPPFHHVGNIAALGITTAWIFSMTFLVAIVYILPLRVQPRSSTEPLPMEWFGDFVVSKRKPLLVMFTATTLGVVSFIPTLTVNDLFVEWFDESTSFRVDSDFASDNLIGPYSLEFSIGSGTAGGITEPEYLTSLAEFNAWLQTQPPVVQVNSFTDVMKRLNKSMHSDDPAWYRLPDARELAAQYLLLYEISLPYGLDLNSQLNLDKSATRMTVSLNSIPTREMREIASRAESWLTQNTPTEMHAEATGATLMFAYLTERNIRTMLVGTAIAFFCIAGILVLALRSFKLGLVSLIPNFVPVLFAFGLWAIFVGEIGIIASVIAATSLGLIVDDTVHLLSKYNRAKREHAVNTHDAIRFTFTQVGTALCATTTILVSGFLVLTFASFRLSVHLGILTGMTLAIAIVLDFLLLPPLLMWIDKDETCDCVTCGAASAA
jgi:hypothetical protein|tara:strand:- start:8708 stop:11047 length:2340 start_codon:yes stop_codon:yes gene_type:complete